ncbi:MAG: DNA repair protein RecN [Proteobacteria bacterium]|nr:DNA repair protein RecN [Pseudomonadota bacterium]
MLLELMVKNFAIIENVRLNFSKSFNVLTGETGAGKSLIIDAILTLMGRGGVDFVRAGCEKAEIEAVFSFDSIRQGLEESIKDEEFLIIRKVISSSGKSKQYINDNFVTQSKVKEIMQKLIHVYGQSEAKELYETSYHTELYDIYCNNTELKENLKKIILEGREVKRELLAIEEQEQKRLQEIDFLKFQIEEIEKANITNLDEDIQLEHRKNILQNREKIIKGIVEVSNLLYESENSAYDILSKGLRILSNMPEKEKVIEESEKELGSIIDIVKNVSRNLSDYINKLEFDNDDIDTVETRLDLLTKLKKKYGGSLEKIINYLKDSKERLQELENLDIEKRELLEKLKNIRENIKKISIDISDRRQKNAKNFEKEIKEQLKDLGMSKSEFKVLFKEVNLENAEDMPLYGKESVEFYFASHIGEPVKPLSNVASGGELSRIMLAIKNVIPKEREMTVIFDEVDSGVGGKTGEMLGKKLREIAKHHQVICITHLPQVAVWADKHIKISKDESGQRVKVFVSELDEEARVSEIARMLGGNLSEKGLEYSREMISKAREVK